MESSKLKNVIGGTEPFTDFADGGTGRLSGKKFKSKIS
jgi:hypothetical protein